MIKKHWNFRYIYNRSCLYVNEKFFPNNPWWTKNSIKIINGLIRKSDQVLEFGSGRSSIWLGKRCKSILSIEHDSKWAIKVKKMADENKINMTLLNPSVNSTIWKENEEDISSYLSLGVIKETKFDIIIIDGLFRDSCALFALNHINKNGLIIIDNINWYLPSNSYSPSSIPNNSIQKSVLWKQFNDLTMDWRRIITSNGVTDTGIFFS
jgi:predicted O-methyltransferase YrrM